MPSWPEPAEVTYSDCLAAGARPVARRGRRRPVSRPGATLGQALDKYLEVADLEVSTKEAHEGYVRRTIRPVLGEAITVHQQVLAARERLLGPDHPDTLRSRGNLAAAYQDADRTGEVRKLNF